MSHRAIFTPENPYRYSACTWTNVLFSRHPSKGRCERIAALPIKVDRLDDEAKSRTDRGDVFSHDPLDNGRLSCIVEAPTFRVSMLNTGSAAREHTTSGPSFLYPSVLLFSVLTTYCPSNMLVSVCNLFTQYWSRVYLLKTRDGWFWSGVDVVPRLRLRTTCLGCLMRIDPSDQHSTIISMDIG